MNERISNSYTIMRCAVIGGAEGGLRTTKRGLHGRNGEQEEEERS